MIWPCCSGQRRIATCDTYLWVSGGQAAAVAGGNIGWPVGGGAEGIPDDQPTLEIERE